MQLRQIPLIEDESLGAGAYYGVWIGMEALSTRLGFPAEQGCDDFADFDFVGVAFERFRLGFRKYKGTPNQHCLVVCHGDDPYGYVDAIARVSGVPAGQIERYDEPW